MEHQRLLKMDRRLSVFLPALLALLALPSASAAWSPPLFTVDLSLPPSARWRGAVGLVVAAHGWRDSFGAAFAAHNVSLFDNINYAQFAILGDALARDFPEQAAELQGIATEMRAYDPSVSYRYLAAWVYFHELAHTDLISNTTGPTSLDVRRSCTAFLAQADDGTVWHGGNMDQSPPAVRNVTLRVDFVRGGEAVFSGVDWYWFTTGVTRAVRKGVASFQENWRTTQLLSSSALLTSLADASTPVVTPQVFLFRQVLQRTPPPTFQELVAIVSAARLGAPFYIIMAGPNRGEGAIIARNATAVEGGISWLGQEMQSGDYFIAQSNYDRWLPDPADDPRRTAAELTLRQAGAAAGANAIGMFAAASTYPVHNPHTAYTAVMHPATGAFHAWARQALCPLTPGNSIVPEPRYTGVCHPQ
eukprot:Hpha_TRINITY_DN16452_c1_g14::TRINITY_DN16452_c1_g14_i1::g.161484::m.161484